MAILKFINCGHLEKLFTSIGIIQANLFFFEFRLNNPVLQTPGNLFDGKPFHTYANQMLIYLDTIRTLYTTLNVIPVPYNFLVGCNRRALSSKLPFH